MLNKSLQSSRQIKGEVFWINMETFTQNIFCSLRELKSQYIIKNTTFNTYENYIILFNISNSVGVTTLHCKKFNNFDSTIKSWYCKNNSKVKIR